MAGMCGATGQARQPSPEEVELAISLKGKVEEELKRKLDTFKPTSVRTQVVAGINYFFKVLVDADEYVHLRVHQDIERKTHVHGVQHGKKEEDVLEYF